MQFSEGLKLPWLLLVFLQVAGGGCSTSSNTPGVRAVTPDRPVKAASPPPPTIRVIFRDGKVFAREGDREWPLAEVGRDEMLWAPDGVRFAYVKAQVPASQPAGAAPKKKKKRRSRRRRKKRSKPRSMYHVIIRNIRGDSVNEFPVYRPGRPTKLDWINDHQLAYEAPPDDTGQVYVIHSVASGEILQLFRGERFVWSPGRKQLAFVTRLDKNEVVKVNNNYIWPRDREPPPPRRRRRGRRDDRRKIVGALTWSPDGSGLAFVQRVGKQTKLVVLLVFDNRGGDMSWPLPNTALAPENRLFWAESKVVIGKSVLKPRFAASWRRVQ